MRRIATPTRQLNKFGPGRDGFTDGDPIAGIPSTDLEADWFDARKEAAAIAEYGGVALDPNDNTQLLQGIQRLIAVALTSRPLICSILDLPRRRSDHRDRMQRVWTWANTAFSLATARCCAGAPGPPHRAAGQRGRRGRGACYRRSESTRACGAMRRSKAWFVRKLCGKPIAARIGSRTTRPRSSACPTCATCSAASRGQTSTLQMREPWEADRSISSGATLTTSGTRTTRRRRVPIKPCLMGVAPPANTLGAGGAETRP